MVTEEMSIRLRDILNNYSTNTEEKRSKIEKLIDEYVLLHLKAYDPKKEEKIRW